MLYPRGGRKEPNGQAQLSANTCSDLVSNSTDDTHARTHPDYIYRSIYLSISLYLSLSLSLYLSHAGGHRLLQLHGDLAVGEGAEADLRAQPL